MPRLLRPQYLCNLGKSKKQEGPKVLVKAGEEEDVSEKEIDEWAERKGFG